MAQTAVQVKNLTKTFGGLHAVDDVSLAVPLGQRCALIGPNGAGKTTLFSCMAGSIRPTSGQVFLFGDEVTRLPERKRTARGLGRTYQITNVFLHLSVLENVLLAVQGTSPHKWISHRSFSGFARNIARAEEALSVVGLVERRAETVSQLSYGERRQLELALALANSPRILLLDEPAAGLSPAERVRIAELVEGLPRQITLILIEHDMDLAMGLADHIAVLHHGALIFNGTPEAVRDNEAVREVYFGNL
jgi:branched-chain amino acid transport system ATP-binding protein